MKLLWQYPLPLHQDPHDSQFEGPILSHNGSVYYAGYADDAVRARDTSCWTVRLHRIDRERGHGNWSDFEVRDPGLTNSWSLTAAEQQVWFYCSTLINASGEANRLSEPLTGYEIPEKAATRPGPLVIGSRMFYATYRPEVLYCFDAARRQMVWSRPLKTDGKRMPGPPQSFGDQIACFGRDALLILDPASGELQDEIRVPRVEKLYGPLEDGEDLLLGYTNNSTAGVLRYHRPTRKVVWQYRRKGRASYTRIWRVDDVVLWVKDDTEVIGVDAVSGEERWRARTAPYLYSRLTVIGTDLLFGTAGRGGAVQVVDALTGAIRWSRSLNNGCAYYALDETAVFVGDFDGCVRRLDLRSGVELEHFDVGAEVVGDIAIDGDRLYTVTWPRSHRYPRLVCIGID